MKNKSLVNCLFAFSLIAGIGTYEPAQAAPKRIEGRTCHFPNVAKGTWVGFLDGWKEVTYWNGKDGRENVTVWRCFKTRADCTAWKYWVQTDYRAGPQLTWCRKK